MPAELRSSDSHFDFTPAHRGGSNKIWEGRRVGDPDYWDGELPSRVVAAPSPPSPTGERARVRWRELAGDLVGRQPLKILFVPRAQRQDDKLRRVVGVLGKNQFLQRGQF